MLSRVLLLAWSFLALLATSSHGLLVFPPFTWSSQQQKQKRSSPVASPSSSRHRRTAISSSDLPPPPPPCLSFLSFNQPKFVCVAISILALGFTVQPFPSSASAAGLTEVDAEIMSVFTKGKQNEVEGFYSEAQQLYEQVVQTEPDFICKRMLVSCLILSYLVLSCRVLYCSSSSSSSSWLFMISFLCLTSHLIKSTLESTHKLQKSNK